MVESSGNVSAGDGEFRVTLIFEPPNRFDLEVDHADPRVCFHGDVLMSTLTRDAATPWTVAGESTFAIDRPWPDDLYHQVIRYDDQFWVPIGHGAGDATVYADAFVGALFHLYARNRTVVYKITGFDRDTGTYVGEWPE